MEYLDLKTVKLEGTPLRNSFHRLAGGISESADAHLKHASGLYCEFETAATILDLQAVVAGRAYMNHLTATATIGFDLYLQTAQGWAFLCNSAATQMPVQLGPAGRRRYRLYFPLYIEVLQAKLGGDAPIDIVSETKRPLVIFYGTSITQGGCASRPGMSYPSIIGRRLPIQIYNFGVSGSAHLEPAMAAAINALAPDVVVVDVEENNTLAGLQEKFRPFIFALQAKKIIVISGYRHSRELLEAGAQAEAAAMRNIQAEVPGTIFVDGSTIFAPYGYEATVDGLHVTDLGFFAIAERLTPLLQEVLDAL